MKTRIAAGETFDTLNEEEIERVLRKVLGEAASEWRRGPQTERPEDGLNVDANGNGLLDLYLVPAGMEFALHRLFITDDTHTFAALATPANSTMDILRNGRRVDGATFGTVGYPRLFTWNNVEALRFRNNEKVSLQFGSMGANAKILALAQGTLQPLTLA